MLDIYLLLLFYWKSMSLHSLRKWNVYFKNFYHKTVLKMFQICIFFKDFIKKFFFLLIFSSSACVCIIAMLYNFIEKSKEKLRENITLHSELLFYHHQNTKSLTSLFSALKNSISIIQRLTTSLCYSFFYYYYKAIPAENSKSEEKKEEMRFLMRSRNSL